MAILLIFGLLGPAICEEILCLAELSVVFRKSAAMAKEVFCANPDCGQQLMSTFTSCPACNGALFLVTPPKKPGLTSTPKAGSQLSSVGTKAGGASQPPTPLGKNLICEMCGDVVPAKALECPSCGNNLVARTPQLPGYRTTPTNQEKIDVENPLEALLTVLGIGDLFLILSTLHAPIRSIRYLVLVNCQPLHQSIIAFIAFIGVTMPLHMAMMRFGEAINYPLIARGPLFEDQNILYSVVMACNIIGFLVMYSLPYFLYKPSTKAAVVSSNIYANLYLYCYNFIFDFVKMMLFAITGNIMLPIIIGLTIGVLSIAFQIYIWRIILGLRWRSVIVFLTIGIVFSSLYFFILGASGLLKLSADN